MKNKITIMNSRPKITDEEITSSMDFNKIVIEHGKALKLRQHQRLIRGISYSALGIAIIVALWFANRPAQPDIEEKGLSKQTLTEKKSLMADSVETMMPKRAEQKTEAPIATQNKPSGKAEGEKESLSETKTPENVVESVPVFIQATPKDGYPALYEYFSRELTYPKEALSDSIQGVVSVSFSIGSAGKPENVTVEQSLGDVFDKEAIRLIEDMPEWNPATYKGTAIPSKMSLPITFQVKNIKSTNHE
jgi:TonB family protein